MRNELVKAISDIKDTEHISTILINMSNRDIFFLQNLLEYADSETQDRWLLVYNQLTKY